MLNLVNILKDAPTHLELWSVDLGKVAFQKIDFDIDTYYPIVVMNQMGRYQRFRDNGALYYSDSFNYPCILWPSEDHKSWENWQSVLFKKGDFIAYESTNDAYSSLGVYVGGDIMFSLNDLMSVGVKLDRCRYATEQEISEIINGLKKEGYELDINGDVVRKSIKIKDGYWYICIKDYFAGGNKRASCGDIVKAKPGMNMMALDEEEASKYFRYATDKEIIKYGEKEGMRSCYNCISAYYRGDGVSCWLHEDCNGDNPYIVTEDEYLDVAGKCKNFEFPENKDTKTTMEKFDFQVGDWLVNNKSGKYVQVTEIDDLYGVGLGTQDGDIYHLSNDAVKDNFHRFTVNDIKKGDILSHEGDEGYTWLFIIRNVSKDEGWYSYYFLLCGDDTVYTDGTAFITDDFIQPASKSETDLLLSKVSEKGYKWYGDKLKLEKVDSMTTDKDIEGLTNDLVCEYKKTLISNGLIKPFVEQLCGVYRKGINDAFAELTKFKK